jgi:hypothetical protein
MLGGQHRLVPYGAPVEERPGLLRCKACERTHCYALRGRFMTTLLEHWQGGGKFDGTVHCDWIMARDPELQFAHMVYAPALFMAGQEFNHSDVMNSVIPRYFWNPPAPDLPILLLRSPASLVEALRPHGIHTGLENNSFTGIDKALNNLYHLRSQGRSAHITRLKKWLELRLWEVSADPHLVCTVWHPNADGVELREATPHPLHVLEAATLEEALEKMPPPLRRPYRALREQAVVIHLSTNNQEVMREARNHGWHNGFQIDPESQLNRWLKTLCQARKDVGRQAGVLRQHLDSLLAEAGTIPGGVPVIWHPEIDPELVRRVTHAKVVEIVADDAREALEQWRIQQRESSAIQP